MKILITGASGCIGRSLVYTLMQQYVTEDNLLDIDIYATDIKENPFRHLKQLCYQQFDICSESFLQWVTEVDPAVIIHLASVLQISKTLTRDKAYQIDVVATEKLLATAAEIGTSKFVVTTSGAAYGYYPENNLGEIQESRATKGNPDYFYSAHKSEVEGILTKFREVAPELKQVVLRPGAIIGPDFEGPVVNLFQQKMITGLVGYEGLFNFIWADDVVQYLIEAATSDITGEFNVAGTGTLSLKQIAEKLDKPYLPLPPWLVKLALTVLKPLGITQYGPEQVKFIKYRPVLSNQKILKTFKHQPKYSTEQALSAYLNHLENS
ncbi:MAG: NAD-dependent epimerase/dehydratase family protein [Gammaproteobacteria bacterium]|nr:NAD-dependent epimerase/dehydratase family protein [Gammaproteobacteria bacterium]